MNKEQDNTVQDTVNEDHMEQNAKVTPEAGEQPETPAAEGAAPEAEAGEQSGLQQKIDRLNAELSDQQQRTLRAQADFDNFRRRTQKEKEELAKYASSKLITELLPVIDNFERALAAAGESPEVESFSKGVSMIFRQLEGVLNAEGLEAMNCVGQPFNPEFHQAIMQVESEEFEEGIVVEEVQKGYMLKDKVLRPAMVKVSM
ncbi:nucleotide exchange factor GrpE [Paenibacillus sp. DMB20]|uniref:nucleotide exchange factor GrpE n=1 Tax=Paenibacillus sp. DMB20 TaxID=1642570 RepID=UPI000627CA70|nr:nucleotide exchange factor GrpE [Paenibacillus sp. DMB20]KKO51286.1 molecular chaperone GrpE [Paenibacillus sp. DMB20]